MRQNDRRLDKTMQRVGNLFNKLCSFDNLLLAYKKAKKGTNTWECKMFEFNLEKELLLLSSELQTAVYQPSEYKYFTVFEPKKREISVASFRDRVVHHALVNILEPIFESSFIFHSYATRKYKGTHAAIRMAQKCVRKNNWFLKCDIQKYFDSIDHAILQEQISKKVKDPKVLQLIAKILQNAGFGRSLPIGNLTSQFFANIYLSEFDHFIKEELHCKYYLRYMDDFVLFEQDKQALIVYRKKVKEFLSGLNCRINPKSSYLNHISNGLSFLGVRIFKNTIRVRRENLKRCFAHCNRKRYAMNQGGMDESTYLSGLNSIFAHLAQYNTIRLCRQWIINNGYLI